MFICIVQNRAAQTTLPVNPRNILPVVDILKPFFWLFWLIVSILISCLSSSAMSSQLISRLYINILYSYVTNTKYVQECCLTKHSSCSVFFSYMFRKKNNNTSHVNHMYTILQCVFLLHARTLTSLLTDEWNLNCIIYY